MTAHEYRPDKPVTYPFKDITSLEWAVLAGRSGHNLRGQLNGIIVLDDHVPFVWVPMSTAAQAYAMLGNQTLWDTARHCHEALRQAGVAYAVVDGVLRRTHKDFADVV
jgi:hypothetical protein